MGLRGVGLLLKSQPMSSGEGEGEGKDESEAAAADEAGEAEGDTGQTV